MSRRDTMKVTGGAAAAALAQALGSQVQAAEAAAGGGGRFRHSVCKWCFGEIPLDEFCGEIKKFGIESVELLGVDAWPTLAKHGMTCAVGTPEKREGLGGIERGFNRREHHDTLVAIFEELIPQAAEAGVPNVICFSGNRDGMDDEEGLEICAEGLKRVAPIAEKHGVTVVMELLNSKVNHPDYMCDHTEWGAELVDKVGSERFKLLYDIYHMQIMEGDVIATFTKHREKIAHFHTAGVPGRHEIDDTQELNYRGISKALVAMGFTGFMAQEFMPRRDPLTSLREAIEICTV